MAAPAVLGGIQLAQGKSARNSAQDAQRSAQRAQARLLNTQERAVSGYLDAVSGYDPAKDTELALQAYDQASNESLNRDIGQSTVASTARGFAPGQSSDSRGGVTNVIRGRAFQRGSLLANMKAGESTRKLQALSGSVGAAGTLGGAASQYGGIAQNYQNQAASYDPSGAISAIGGAFRGFRFPWQRRPNASGIGASAVLGGA